MTEQCTICDGIGRVTVQTVDDDQGVAYALPDRLVFRIKCPWCQGPGNREQSNPGGMMAVKTHKHQSDGRWGTRAFAGCVARSGHCKPATHGKTTYVLSCTCGATKLMNQNGGRGPGTREHGPWKENHLKQT